MGKMIRYVNIGFFCTNHVYAEYRGNRNCKDESYGHLNNQYTRSAYDFHN